MNKVYVISGYNDAAGLLVPEVFINYTIAEKRFNALLEELGCSEITPTTEHVLKFGIEGETMIQLSESI